MPTLDDIYAESQNLANSIGNDWGDRVFELLNSSIASNLQQLVDTLANPRLNPNAGAANATETTLRNVDATLQTIATSLTTGNPGVSNPANPNIANQNNQASDSFEKNSKGLFHSIGGAFSSFVRTLKSIMSALEGLFGKLLEWISFWDKLRVDSLKSLSFQQEYLNQATAAGWQFFKITGDATVVAKTLGDIFNQVRSKIGLGTSDQAVKIATDLQKVSLATGAETKGLANLLGVYMSTGMNVKNIYSDIGKIISTANRNGVEWAGVIREIADLGGKIYYYMRGNLDTLSNAAIMMGKYKGGLKDAVGLVESLADAEKAIELSSKARLVLGVDLNAQYMQMLAQTGQTDKLIQYVVSQLQMSGKSYNDLTYQQMKFLEQFGFGQQTMANILGGVNQSATTDIVQGTEVDGINKMNASLGSLATTANEVEMRMRMMQRAVLDFNIFGKSIESWTRQLGPAIMVFGAFFSFLLMAGGAVLTVIGGVFHIVGALLGIVFSLGRGLVSIFSWIFSIFKTPAAAGAGAGATAGGAWTLMGTRLISIGVTLLMILGFIKIFPWATVGALNSTQIRNAGIILGGVVVALVGVSVSLSLLRTAPDMAAVTSNLANMGVGFVGLMGIAGTAKLLQYMFKDTTEEEMKKTFSLLTKTVIALIGVSFAMSMLGKSVNWSNIVPSVIAMAVSGASLLGLAFVAKTLSENFANISSEGMFKTFGTIGVVLLGMVGLMILFSGLGALLVGFPMLAGFMIAGLGAFAIISVSLLGLGYVLDKFVPIMGVLSTISFSSWTSTIQDFFGFIGQYLLGMAALGSMFFLMPLVLLGMGMASLAGGFLGKNFMKMSPVSVGNEGVKVEESKKDLYGGFDLGPKFKTDLAEAITKALGKAVFKGEITMTCPYARTANQMINFRQS